VRCFLRAVLPLPLPRLDAASALLALIAYQQQRKVAAEQSHRTRVLKLWAHPG
jgi:hypothetical protein